MVKWAENIDMLKGCRTRIYGPKVSLIQYADDSLFFLQPKEEQIRYLRGLLLIFEVVAGLKVNFKKTKMFGIGPVHNLNALASLLNCSVAYLPDVYFGLPLGAKYKSTSLWQLVVERVDKQLATWKGNYLSKGGKWY